MKFTKKFITALALAGILSITACGDKNKDKDKTNEGGNQTSENGNNNQQDPPKPPVEEDNYEAVAEFEEPVDMHTPEQKAFVDYKATGNYEDLTSTRIQEITGQNSGGRLNISAPAGIPVSFTYNDPEEVDHYVLEFSKDEAFENGVYTFEGDKDATSITAYNLEIGQKYFYRIGAVDADDNVDYSNPRELETADAAPRNLYIDGMTNCRDLGGRHTVDGGRIKQGLFFRTAALDDSQSGSIITAKGKLQMKDLGFKTEIELRGGSSGSGGEAKKENESAYGEGMNINFKYIPFAYSNGKNLLFRNIEPVRKVFDVLGEPSNYPVFFHCRIGTDRTGLIALLSNALLGVELQEIFQDYLFSDFCCIGKVPTVGQANEDSIAEYVEELKAFPGEKLQNKVYNFLLTAGVPKTKLDNMINFLTEPGSVTGNDVKKVEVETVAHMNTELTINTVDITTNFNQTTRSPANYVEFKSSGQKVSYSFNSSEAFTADLYANLCSKTTSGTLSGAFKVTVNGTEVTVANTSFATSALGFDRNIECWIPSKLAEVSFIEGYNTVELESKGSTSIKFSQFAFSSMSSPAFID